MSVPCQLPPQPSDPTSTLLECWYVALCALPHKKLEDAEPQNGMARHRFLHREGKGNPSWAALVCPSSNAKGIETDSWDTHSQPWNSPGTELEVAIITVLPVYFRPNELTFTQRKQGVNPISELSEDWCWIHYRRISFFNTVYWISFCRIPIPSKYWCRKWFKIKPECVVQW